MDSRLMDNLGGQKNDSLQSCVRVFSRLGFREVGVFRVFRAFRVFGA